MCGGDILERCADVLSLPPVADPPTEVVKIHLLLAQVAGPHFPGGPQPEMEPQPRTCVLVASGGRSGTHFLQKVFETCSSTTSLHEPSPDLSSLPSLDPDSLKAAIKTKVEAIAHAASSCTMYVETNHTLLHGSHWSLVVEALLERFSELVIVVPMRDPVHVIMSRLKLGHGTVFKKDGKPVIRGDGWIYTGESNLASLPPVKPDKDCSALDVLCAYVVCER